MILKIAFRNILRNGRRTIMTLMAVAVSAVAMLLFAAFMMASILGIRTGSIQQMGNLSVFQKDYFEFGSGNPAAYGIADYKTVMRIFGEDPELKPLIRVITPTISLMGIAGNAEQDTSKTFMGIGVVPSDKAKMRTWNEHGLGNAPDASPEAMGLADDQPARGYVGIGMARVLGLCQRLNQKDCPPDFKKPKREGNVEQIHIEDFSDLAADGAAPSGDEPKGPKLDLLAATASGAPNVVSLNVNKAISLGNKAIDDMYVGMHIDLAQQLVYGRHEPKVTAVEIQLHHEADQNKARARLETLFKEKALDLEVRDFAELTPMYSQVMNLFGSIFLFIAIVMGVIVLFTVVNTMSMSVMERINEIGTTRALGVRRSGIHRQFLAEGWLLGVIGSTAGVVLSYVFAWMVNHSGIRWTPPGYNESYPLYLPIHAIPTMVFTVWLALMAMATLAALIPAGRAARMAVVDALRHV